MSQFVAFDSLQCPNPHCRINVGISHIYWLGVSRTAIRFELTCPACGTSFYFEQTNEEIISAFTNQGGDPNSKGIN